MVWPSSSGSAGANPPRPGAPADPASSASGPPDRARKKKAKVASTRSSRSQSEIEGGRSWINRTTVETGVLILALVVIGGIIGYIVWPASAEYLYKQAEPLMASESRANWDRALADYIVPLDDRFKDHPYREQTAPGAIRSC